MIRYKIIVLRHYLKRKYTHLQVDRLYGKVIMLLKIFLIFRSALMVGIFLHVQFINLGVI